MSINRNSKVILAKNIKMDSEYRNVLNITEDNMLALMINQANLVYSDSTYSFLREEINSIYVNATYSTCLQANYLAFQNPDYSNKYFFAFIESVEYVNDKTTRIRYKIDLFTTWRSYFDLKSCFVIREHVTSDGIGEHTVPEGLETGDYIINSNEVLLNDQNQYICISTSDIPNGVYRSSSRTYARVYSGEYYYIFENGTNASNFIRVFEANAMGNAINHMFVVPSSLIKSSMLEWHDISATHSGEQVSSHYAVLDSFSYIIIAENKSISMNNSLNGYSPSNNKLKCFPYNYIEVTNNSGGALVYKYENFVNNDAKFSCYGSINPSCSIRVFPINYNKISDDTTLTAPRNSYNDGLTAGKYPICNWSSDVYTNWLTQTSVNRNIQTMNNFVSAIGSTVKAVNNPDEGNPRSIAGDVMSIFQTAGDVYQHSLTPDATMGNTNSGDVNFASSNLVILFNKKSIKQEYARIIDNIFRLRGYKVNTVKVPNISHRQNFNFVQIANEDSCCYSNNYNNIQVPPRDLSEINDLFRRGITIWNNHEYLGDMSVSNNIVN